MKMLIDDRRLAVNPQATKNNKSNQTYAIVDWQGNNDHTSPPRARRGRREVGGTGRGGVGKTRAQQAGYLLLVPFLLSAVRTTTLPPLPLNYDVRYSNI